MKNYKKSRLVTFGKKAVVVGGLSLAAAPVFALDASVSTALASAGTDSVTVAGAVFVIIVGIFAIKILRKAL